MQNSSELWAESFKTQLNCVSCRSYDKPRQLYFIHTREQVDIVNTPVQYILDHLTNIDVWCDDCTVRRSFHTQTQGRLTRKLEAAAVANLEKRPWFDSANNKHVVLPNITVDKREFYDVARSFPCMHCGETFPSFVMEFHHIEPKYRVVNALVTGQADIRTVIAEMEKCVLVCANCQRLYQYSDIKPPKLWQFDDYKDKILEKITKV